MPDTNAIVEGMNQRTRLLNNDIKKHMDIYLSTLLSLVFIVLILCITILAYKRLFWTQLNTRYYSRTKLCSEEGEFMLPREIK